MSAKDDGSVHTVHHVEFETVLLRIEALERRIARLVALVAALSIAILAYVGAEFFWSSREFNSIVSTNFRLRSETDDATAMWVTHTDGGGNIFIEDVSTRGRYGVAVGSMRDDIHGVWLQADGRVVAKLSGDDGAGRLELLGAGDQAATLALSAGGGAKLLLRCASGVATLCMELNAQGDASIFVIDKDGDTQVLIGN